MRRPLFLACFAALAAAASPAAVLRVPQDHATIQGAIDAAAPGDVIRVGPGTYRESLVLNKGLTLEAVRGPSRTRIVGVGPLSAQSIMRIAGAPSVVRGFTLTNAAPVPQGLFLIGNGHSIEENVFDGTDQGPSTSGTAVHVFTGSARISRNVFLNHDCDSQFTSSVVTISNSAPVALSDNLFLNNDCRAVLDMGQALTAVNNTLVGNRVGFELQAFGDLANNIVVAGGAGIVVRTAFAPMLRHNLVSGNGTDYVGVTDPTGTAGNLDAPPGFQAPAAADYRLRRDSAAIDAGLDPVAPAVDLEGLSRPMDGDRDGTAAADIGAYERRGPRPNGD